MTGYAACAASDANSRGRRHPEPPPSHRSEFQRDRDRIIHSAAFRRLEYKTQVFVNHEGDLFRTRLTHSIEVAQIARTIARALQLNEDLTETIALAHDLGHTPFGHAGQDALNACMKDYGGFEHNLQSLRVVDELEERYAEFRGLNLTFEAREGILKHCSLPQARLLGEIGERFLNRRQPGLEAQLTNLADEIAYNSHDVDDGLRAGLITLEQLNAIDLFREQYEEVRRRYPQLPERRSIHEVVRRLINCQAVDLIETSRARLDAAAPADIEAVRAQPEPLVAFSDGMREKNLELKRFLRSQLYRHYRVHRMTAKATRVIQALFTAFFDDVRLMPQEAQHASAELADRQGEAGRARAVADYIAGMTDRFAIAEYERVYNPKELT
ncbi:dGTP triphosphohydrolase [Thiohalobacter thiocyanaticus]|uniref:Deoxyguanosinetriphosphate triphosphohydrolase-like protein n=1 Tax=Thiohalobacter thiocyanaticus TaxID=585455 RepID=A0A1Z4VLL0_9GAMM|nr:deoxyguanosinetriphosphate triphosphohydrolase [Thiohalobacter thiocyanaticus]BAZ92480.1 dGTP triphosphohydrolase [Thiohalobacter thiocyanaticus]